MLPAPLHMDRGGHPGRMAVPGEVFRHIHVTWPQTVDGAVAQADFCLPRQGDDVLPPGGGMPVTKRAGECRTEHHPLSALERRQLRVGRQIQLFHMRLAIVARIQAENAHCENSSLCCGICSSTVEVPELWDNASATVGRRCRGTQTSPPHDHAYCSTRGRVVTPLETKTTRLRSVRPQAVARRGVVLLVCTTSAAPSVEAQPPPPAPRVRRLRSPLVHTV